MGKLTRRVAIATLAAVSLSVALCGCQTAQVDRCMSDWINRGTEACVTFEMDSEGHAVPIYLEPGETLDKVLPRY